MKKLIIALLALAVVGVCAFAQDAAAAAPAPALKWGGYLDTGLYYSQTGSAKATLQTEALNFGGWDPILGSGDDPAFDLFASYSADTYGFKFRLRSNYDDFSSSKSTFIMNRCYGWFNLFNNMVQLSAGKFGHGTYQTQQNEQFGDWYRTNGVAIDVMPIEGLKFGAMLPVPTTQTNFNDMTKLAWAGFDYTMKGIGEVVFSYQSKKNTMTGSSGINIEQFGATDLGASVVTDKAWATAYLNVTAVDNLTAFIEAQFANLGDSDFGENTYNVHVDYALGNLDPGLAVVTQTNANSDYGTAMTFDLFCYYTMGNAKMGADIDYNTVSKPDAKTGYTFGPNVTFTLGKDSSLELAFYYQGGDVSDGWTYITDPTTSFLIDYVWQF